MKTILMFLCTVFFLGCAQKLASPTSSREIPVTDSMYEATASGRWNIMASENLTEDQKKELLLIMNKTEEKVNEIKRNQAQLKAGLFQSISEGNFNRKEMSNYKRNLKRLESKKMDIMFSNLNEVRTILTKSDKDYNNEEFLIDIYKGMGWW